MTLREWSAMKNHSDQAKRQASYRQTAEAIKARSRSGCHGLKPRSCGNSKFKIAVAPETGSDRLRKVINKNLTNDEIVDICGAVFDRGMLTVKFYLMVGLPTETDEDLEEMIKLVERIKDACSKPASASGAWARLFRR